MNYKIVYPFAATCLLLGLSIFHLPGNSHALAHQSSRAEDTSENTPQCGISLLPREQSKSGIPGEVIPYTLILYNHHPYPDSFFLEIGLETWKTTPYSDQVGPVPAGASVPVTITVTIPNNVDWYSSASVEVFARSVYRHAQVSEPARLITQAYAPPHLSFEPDSLVSVQCSGQIVTQTLTLHNGNGIPLTYRILIPGHKALDNWLTIVHASGTVASNQALTVPVVFDATHHQSGVITREIYLDTNDPDQGHIVIPVEMQVVDLPERFYLPVMNK